MSTEKLLLWKEQGLTLSEISKQTGIHRDTWKYRYKIAGIDFNRYVSKSKWSMSRLEDATDVDGQYVIGFLAADGCLDIRSVNVFIQERDIEVLERISRILERPDASLVRRTNTSGYKLVGLNICSVSIKRFLEDQYGFQNKKSRTLPFPVWLINPLPYLRGLFDGDGYMGQSCTFTTGSKDFAIGLLNWVKRKYGYEPNIQMCGENKDVYNIHFRKKHERFIRDLFTYQGLNRKTEAFLKYLPKNQGIEAMDKKPSR